jgi:hypothetical protein
MAKQEGEEEEEVVYRSLCASRSILKKKISRKKLETRKENFLRENEKIKMQSQ